MYLCVRFPQLRQSELYLCHSFVSLLAAWPVKTVQINITRSVHVCVCNGDWQSFFESVVLLNSINQDLKQPTHLLLQSALQPLVGYRPAELPLSILSRKVLQSAVASGTSNSQVGGEPGI
jgi:hypothetical protein